MLNQINQMMAQALQCFQSGNHDEAEIILIKVLGPNLKILMLFIFWVF
jgi:hypothetical protein